MGKWVVAVLCLLVWGPAEAETLLKLEATAFPPEVKAILQQVRSECRQEGQKAVDDPQAGVTIVDLDRNGSKDIVLEAWRACSVDIKNFGACNTAGCELKIFKDGGGGHWKKVLDEMVGNWFLSTSKEGYVRLMAVTVSHKLRKCPNEVPGCDFLIYWEDGDWRWQRLR